MICVRSPLRLSLGGGGTDLPSYYRKVGGELLAAGIDKYVTLELRPLREDVYRLSLDRIGEEQSATLEELRHALSRECLRWRDVPPGIEIRSYCDIPPRSGLGSSGAFTVGLLAALSVWEEGDRNLWSADPKLQFRSALAEEACRIEIEILNSPIGKQDQYASAFSGFRHFTFHPDESVEVRTLKLSEETKETLQKNLLLFFTGLQRNDQVALREQREKTETLDREVLRNLDFTKENGRASALALEGGNMREFAKLLDEHWQNKRKRTSGVSNSTIDELYATAMANGALGGKLIGGGGAGFFMFYTEDAETLTLALKEIGGERIAFAFDEGGTRLLHGRVPKEESR